MPGRALFSSLGLAIGRKFRVEEIMAAVALQSVEYVHGLQLDSVQLKHIGRVWTGSTSFRMEPCALS